MTESRDHSMIRNNSHSHEQQALQRRLTHGYIHGHIHKHEDHAHIHGHIHNHDHGVASNLKCINEDTCEGFNEELLCKEVLCGELDDCFYTLCNDISPIANDSQQYDYSCGHIHRNEQKTTSLTPQKNLTQEVDSLVESYKEKCDPSELPAYEDLIEKVYQKLDNNNRNEKDTKEIHVHPCRQNNVWSAETQDSSYPFLTAFHSKIPSSNLPLDANALSDYNFVIQYDNMHLGSTDSYNDWKLLESSRESALSLRSSPVAPQDDLYSCLWRNCQTKLNSQNFLKHMINLHISQQYGDLNQCMNGGHGAENRNSHYQCEWNDCEYIQEDLASLITHMNTHMYPQQTQEMSNEFHVMTPNSGTLSNLESPESIFPNKADPILSISLEPKLPAKSGNRSKKCCATKTEDGIKCMWQVGLDLEGRPIPCGQMLASEGDLQRHLMNDHMESGRASYSCDWIGCPRHNGAKFIQRQKVVRHIHIHTNYKPFNCDQCGSKFATNELLEQHKRVHSGEKPYECKICGKRFATSSSFSVHNRVHTGEKPLQCKICNKRFSESSNLAKHMKAHTKSFRCEYCGLELSKKSLYQKHILLHRSNAPNKIPESSFTALSTLT